MAKPSGGSKAKAKPPPKGGSADDGKSQRERFIEAAREVGVDETGEALERAFAKIVPPKPKRSG
jgi:hypothetical protein